MPRSELRGLGVIPASPYSIARTLVQSWVGAPLVGDVHDSVLGVSRAGFRRLGMGHTIDLFLGAITAVSTRLANDVHPAVLGVSVYMEQNFRRLCIETATLQLLLSSSPAWS